MEGREKNLISFYAGHLLKKKNLISFYELARVSKKWYRGDAEEEEESYLIL